EAFPAGAAALPGRVLAEAVVFFFLTVFLVPDFWAFGLFGTGRAWPKANHAAVSPPTIATIRFRRTALTETSAVQLFIGRVQGERRPATSHASEPAGSLDHAA